MRFTLKVLAAAALGWAALIALSGGLSFGVGPLTVRARDPLRPILFALICLGGYALLTGRRQLVQDIRALPRTIPRAAPLAAAALGLFVLAAGLRYGTFVAGGADPYGYVSQAELWEQGRLEWPQPLVSELPWPEALVTLAPLGYTPGPGGAGIVPTYAPGLPLLMALFRRALGPCAQYYVVPLLGGLAVWLTFVLGRRLTGRPSVGVGAALVFSTSMPVVFALLWPMSDVPATAAWTLALFLVLPGTSVASLLAGLASSVAVLIRPNLAPLGAVIGGALLWRTIRDRRFSVRGLGPPLAFACGLLPGIVLMALINDHLYGSPLRSGYGSLRALYALGNLAPNVRHYFGWILESQSAYVLVGTAAVLGLSSRTLAPSRSPLPLRVLFAGFIGVVCVSYLFYVPFEAWWYLRFLLPVWPLAIVLAAAFTLDLLLRLRLPAAPAVLVGVALVLSLLGYRSVRAYGMLVLRQVESRYAIAGTYVGRTTAPGTVVFAMQHSGSVRYYGGRQSIRYDFLDPDWLDRGVAALTDRGHRVLLLLDDWEEPAFRKRFGAASRLGRLDWMPIAQLSGAGRVRLYDLTDLTTGRFTPIVPSRDRPCSGAPIEF